MAFRQPIVAPRRLDPPQEPQSDSLTVPVSTQQAAHDESREWVLFPPSQAFSTSQTRTTFTARTPQTAGRSRISDFGSIGITARSDGNERDLARDGDDEAREEEELDSLDEGLHAFHDPTVDRYTRFLGRSGTILPTHDGLGMFPPSSLQVQEHLWQFEQHNPRKRMADTQLSSSSLRRHLDITADVDETKLDRERRQRIENWRIDQARLLLDEIEKQSRKIRRSQSSVQRDICTSSGSRARGVESSVSGSMHQYVGGMEGSNGGDNQQESSPKETLLEGITRRLCDLLGIDDFLLSIIFGDALPVDETPSRSASLSLPELDSFPNEPTRSSLLPEGHGRLLNRLTRELGFFIQEHMSKHPGAFSTHLHLPLGPDIMTSSAPSPSLSRKRSEKSLLIHDLDGSSAAAEAAATAAASLSPHFSPTLQVQPEKACTMSKSETTNAALWGIEEEEVEEEEEEEGNKHLRIPSIAEERAYWERTPDVKSIFRLLHTRFAAADQHEPQQPPLPPNLNSNLSANLNKNTATAPNNTLLASMRRASVICQHHPLVSVSKGDGPSSARRTRNSLLNQHTHHHFHHHHHHHHHQHNQHSRQISSLLRRAYHSYSYSYSYSNSINSNIYSYSNSCASENLLSLRKTKSKSKSKRASGGGGSSSSRCYWDLDLGWNGC